MSIEYRVASSECWRRAALSLLLVLGIGHKTAGVCDSVSTVTLETIGMYHVAPGDFAFVKSLGIESVQVPLHAVSSKEEAEARLAEAQKNGLKVFFGLYEKSIESRQILRNVEIYKIHPEISYWYLADEPDIKGIEPDMIRQMTQYINITDSKKRPVFITVSDLNFGPKDDDRISIRGKAYSAYKDAADIVGVLRYEPPRKLRIFLNSFVFPEVSGERWWAIVSLNQQPDDLKKSVDLFMEGKPSGILYYAFADENWGFNLRDRTDIQEALKEINAALRPGESKSGRADSSVVQSQSTTDQAASTTGSSGMPPWIRSPVMDLSKPLSAFPPLAVPISTAASVSSTETVPAASQNPQ